MLVLAIVFGLLSLGFLGPVFVALSLKWAGFVTVKFGVDPTLLSQCLYLASIASACKAKSK